MHSSKTFFFWFEGLSCKEMSIYLVKLDLRHLLKQILALNPTNWVESKRLQTWNDAYSAGRKGWSKTSRISLSAQTLCTWSRILHHIINKHQQKQSNTNRSWSNFAKDSNRRSNTLFRLSMMLLSIAFIAKSCSVPQSSTRYTLLCERSKRGN